MKLTAGLEINEEYLKLVVTKSQGPRQKPFFYIVNKVSSLTEEQISSLISENFRKNKLRIKSSVLCLSRNLVTVRNLHLPSKDKQEIMQMIDLNIARIVPYKKEEIVFSYRILGVDEMGYTKVILAIVKSDIIRRQSKIIEKAGLNIDTISLSSFGIWEWVADNHRVEINPTDLYLVLDIDSAFTDFIIFSQSNLIFTRSINVGSNRIRDNKEIEITKLLGEVKQSLIMFYNEEINKKPATIFISGAGISDDFKSIIEGESGISVKSVNVPYTQEGLEDRKEGVLYSDVSFTGISELVLKESDRRIDFILPEIQIRKSLREKTKELIFIGTLVVYFFSLVFAIFFTKIYNQQNYFKKVYQRYSEVEKDLGELTGYLNKIDSVKSYLTNRQISLFVLSKLQLIIPEEISIDSLNIDENNKVIISGQANQLTDIFNFVGTLEKIIFFKDVQTKNTRKKKVKDKDLTEFELIFSIGV